MALTEQQEKVCEINTIDPSGLKALSVTGKVGDCVVTGNDRRACRFDFANPEHRA